MPSDHRPVSSLYIGAVAQRSRTQILTPQRSATHISTSLPVAGGTSEISDGVTSTSRFKNDLQDFALFCTECEHKPPLQSK